MQRALKQACLPGLLLLLLAAHQVSAKRMQVFGFAVDQGPTFRGYDWSLLTTSAWKTDPELIELAQQHGAKVELNAGDVRSVMGDSVKRQEWVRGPIFRTGCLRHSGSSDSFQSRSQRLNTE
jgi:hypothetical protein